MFKNLPTADFSAFGAPVQKLIDLNTATMTKAFELQKAAIEKQIAQSQADFKAVSEIKNPEALTAFFTAKSEEAKKSLETFQADAQVAAESTKAYFTEVQAILTESKDVVVKATKKSA
ncbi:phasin family protein [Marinobacterium sedimentorum]|uniref:phasin family protein n=1 Tax=Marinobacterium sedimentorum TaxID=2927804 RepID=UPI0020C74347|nr:phasin family protein [Marinobacterium sedimentorum]MCP8688042.1 phasin family protein [Marinobacterium sedimentorum]